MKFQLLFIPLSLLIYISETTTTFDDDSIFPTWNDNDFTDVPPLDVDTFIDQSTTITDTFIDQSTDTFIDQSTTTTDTFIDQSTVTKIVTIPITRTLPTFEFYTEFI